jgi:hypothetical protein
VLVIWGCQPRRGPGAEPTAIIPASEAPRRLSSSPLARASPVRWPGELAAALLLLLLLASLGFWLYGPGTQHDGVDAKGDAKSADPQQAGSTKATGPQQPGSQQPGSTTATGPQQPGSQQRGTAEPRPTVALSTSPAVSSTQIPATPEEAQTAVQLHSAGPRLIAPGLAEINLEVELLPSIPDAPKRAIWNLLSAPGGASIQKDGLTAILRLPVREEPYEFQFKLVDWEQPKQFTITLDVHGLIQAKAK